MFLAPAQAFQRRIKFFFAGRNHRFARDGHQITLPLDPIIQPSSFTRQMPAFRYLSGTGAIRCRSIAQ